MPAKTPAKKTTANATTGRRARTSPTTTTGRTARKRSKSTSIKQPAPLRQTPTIPRARGKQAKQDLAAEKLRREQIETRVAELELQRLEQSVKEQRKPREEAEIREVLLAPEFFPRLQPKQRAFLAIYAASAHIGKAAHWAKIHRDTHYHWHKTDEYYRAAFAECERFAAQVLQSEAFRRAHRGTKRPVYQGGVEVGFVVEYSDSLAMFLLKGLMPERYGDKLKMTWDGDPSSLTDEQLDKMIAYFEKRAFGGDSAKLEAAKQKLLEVESKLADAEHNAGM